MKKMNRYVIHCTEEQTRKALELGAPIEILPNYTEYRTFPLVKCKDGYERPCIIPTAEQMIGWLECISTIQLQIDKQMVERGTRYRIWVREECKPFSDIIVMHDYPTRKEATLAAINVALDYLIKTEK